MWKLRLKIFFFFLRLKILNDLSNFTLRRESGDCKCPPHSLPMVYKALCGLVPASLCSLPHHNLQEWSPVPWTDHAFCLEPSSLHLYPTQSYLSFRSQRRHHFLQRSSLLCKSGLGDLPFCFSSSPSYHQTAWQLSISWSVRLRIWGEQRLGLSCWPLHSQLLAQRLA